jgi:hypothetical protein
MNILVSIICSLLIGIVCTASLAVDLPEFKSREKLSHDEVLAKIRSNIQSDPLAQLLFTSDKHYTRDYQPCPEFNQSAAGQPWNNLRLPTNVLPTSYEIELMIPYFTSDVYVGVSQTTLELNQSTDTFIFHAKLIAIEGIVLFDNQNKVIPVKCAGYYVPNDYFIIKTESMVDITSSPLNLGLTFGGFLFLFESGLAKLNYEGGIKK